jgi:hypothetical protein
LAPRLCPFTVVVEGLADEELARRVVSCLGGSVERLLPSRGKNGLDQALSGYDAAAKYSPWFVLRDLDQDAPCGAALVRRLLPEPSEGMCFRIAVRSAEAWLLADRAHVAKWLAVSENLIPRDPDELDDPKAELIKLAKRSRRRVVRDDCVPSVNSGRKVGPGFVGQVIDYSRELWRPERAAERSPSLARCLRALKLAVCK